MIVTGIPTEKSSNAACDHKIIVYLAVAGIGSWGATESCHEHTAHSRYKRTASYGPMAVGPAAKVLPWMDQKLKHCKGRDDWGE